MVFSNARGSIDRTMPAGAIPALAMTTSMPPKRSTVPSTARSSASQSVTSASKGAALGPHCAATRASSSGSSPTSATLAPAAAARRDVSAPIPRAAPVTKTVLPRSSQVMAGSLTQLAHQLAVRTEGRLGAVAGLEQAEVLEQDVRGAVGVAQVEPAVVGHAVAPAQVRHRAHHPPQPARLLGVAALGQQRRPAVLLDVDRGRARDAGHARERAHRAQGVRDR